MTTCGRVTKYGQVAPRRKPPRTKHPPLEGNLPYFLAGGRKVAIRHLHLLNAWIRSLLLDSGNDGNHHGALSIIPLPTSGLCSSMTSPTKVGEGLPQAVDPVQANRFRMAAKKAPLRIGYRIAQDPPGPD